MPDYELFMYPGACSRVTMNALAEAGAEYRESFVDLGANGQKAPGYLAVNPKGKVPSLRIDGEIMTENAAIIHFLDQQHPDAHLLPRFGGGVQIEQGLVDLIWCAGTLHPIVRQCRAPQRYTQGDVSGVRADGLEKFAHEAERLGGRLAGGRWWYGAAWSIVDVYLYWCYTTAEKGGFPLRDYPHVVSHAERVRARPSFQAARAREEAAIAAHRAEMPADFKM